MDHPPEEESQLVNQIKKAAEARPAVLQGFTAHVVELVSKSRIDSIGWGGAGQQDCSARGMIFGSTIKI